MVHAQLPMVIHADQDSDTCLVVDCSGSEPGFATGVRTPGIATKP
jgi:hypothetical protein